MALSKEILDEIQRKASQGIALTDSTPEKQAIYDQYAQSGTKNASGAISDTMLKEIQRKAQAGIPLTDYTTQKQELYNNYANPLPTYQTYTPTSRPTYNSQYQSQIDSVLQSLLNTPAFSYDYKSDPLYSQYKESYNREGDRALSNAMGEASALTGGRPSSYAMTAGQQAQNYYNSQLNDKIPELQQLAYSMYMNDLSNKRSNVNTLQGLETMKYGQYRDSVNDWQYDTNLGYQQAQDLNNYNWSQYSSQRDYLRNVLENDRRFDYQQSRDDITDSQCNQNFDRQQSRDEVGDSQWERAFNRGNYEYDTSLANSNYWKELDYQKDFEKQSDTSGLTYTQKYNQLKSLLNEKQAVYETNEITGEKKKTGDKNTNTVEDVYNRVMQIARSEDEAIKLLNDLGISMSDVEKAKRERMQNDFSNSYANFKQYDYR